MAVTQKGREHEEKMKKMELDAKARETAANNAAAAEADRIRFEDKEKERMHEQRMAQINAKIEEEKVRKEYDLEKYQIDAENDTKLELAQKQVDIVRIEQEGKTSRTNIEETQETARVQAEAERDTKIALSDNETRFKIREQDRLENQFREDQITARGIELLKFLEKKYEADLLQLDRDRERKHLEYEKMIDSTRQRQRELHASFDTTGDINILAQISECETTLQQYINLQKRDDKKFATDRMLLEDDFHDEYAKQQKLLLADNSENME